VNNSDTPSSSSETLAFLTLRVWLGARALIAGVEKFAGTVSVQQPLVDAAGNPDPSGAVVEIDKKVYSLSNYHAVPDSLQTSFASQPLLPEFLTKPYYAVLGYVLIALGAALLLGIKSRAVLFVMGLLYTSLTFGLMLIKQDPGVAWLAIHIIMIALALVWEKHNRYTLLN
jgi:thiosulfate dehydrogenase (quinone) large subunit